MKIRRFIKKRRRRTDERKRRINDQITELKRRGLQVITANDIVELAKLDAVGGKTIVDSVTCPPHDLELIGQRGPEVLCWRCRRCGVELS